MNADPIALEELANAARTKKIVRGYTHSFYNYPARFSPLFVRETIRAFTKPGDLVMDPFMGGGTTLVESKMLNRHSIGFDISSLAHFVTKVKTTSLSQPEIQKIRLWSASVVSELKCSGSYSRPIEWIEAGYLKNFSEKSVWPIRILIEKFLYELENKTEFSSRVTNFLRAALLKTGQWALDSKKEIPTASAFRDKLRIDIDSMLAAISTVKIDRKIKVICKNKSATTIHSDGAFAKLGAPRLIVTSPPYPGVHVMYHRWQIQSRRETPVPFWIANSMDGQGLSHYTMGDRHEKGLRTYFQNIAKSFESIAKVCDKETTIVQMIAFSDVSWQLDKYLDTMFSAGYVETLPFRDRLWRNVPNRKWYAQQKGQTSSAKEVVLFHKLR